jgi:hypothetical protein
MNTQFNAGDVIRAGNEIRTVQIIGNEKCAVRDGYYCTLREYLDFASKCGVEVERLAEQSHEAAKTARLKLY